MADDEGEKKPEVNQISLKVVTQDGNEIFFKCKMTTPLEKLMKVRRARGVATSCAHDAAPWPPLTPWHRLETGRGQGSSV